jgi:glycosyltransferase involved in cell wall biosynthesis
MMFAGGTPFHVVPNCIDLHQFSPREDKEKLKEKYGIPSDRKIILFGAVDPHSNRKGGDLLLNALMELKNPEHYAIAVFGTSSGGDIAGIKTIRLGPVFDPERIAEIYNCADVMCVPSRQDNLPNTCVEAHACGLPIVAFNIGGIPDIVNDRKTGYLADAFDSQAFAAGIRWVLGKDKMDYHELSDAARSRAVELFDGTAVANKYIEIYKKSMEQF